MNGSNYGDKTEGADQAAGAGEANTSTSVQLSARLKGAWLKYGLEELRVGLAVLEGNIDHLTVENIGIDEAPFPTKIPFTHGDLFRIDELDKRSILRHKRQPSRSLVVRQALEQVILMWDDQDFAKPPNWTARPLDGAQGGKSAWTLPSETITKSFSIPLYLYRRIEHLRTPKGTTAHDPTKPNLSRWMRETIDAIEPVVTLKELVPPVCRKLKDYTTTGTVPLVLQEEQLEKLLALQTAIGCNQSEAIAVAVAYKLQFKPNESIWSLWRSVATLGLEAASEQLGLELDVITKQLIVAGYLKESPPKMPKDSPPVKPPDPLPIIPGDFSGSDTNSDREGLEPTDLPPEPSSNGGGFGNSEKNQLVEKAAIDAVQQDYETRGWVVESVEHKNCGYDLECLKEEAAEHVEVKGISGQESRFIITAGEVQKAKEDSNFVLWVVTAALERPRLQRYSRDEFLESFTLKVKDYWASLK